MPTTFKISQTTACWVTWTSHIEAETEEEAARTFWEGFAPETDEEIGDSLDGYDDGMKLLAIDGQPLEAARNLPYPPEA